MEFSRFLEELRGRATPAALEVFKLAKGIAMRFGEVSGDWNNIYDTHFTLDGWEIAVTHGDYDNPHLFSAPQGSYVYVCVGSHRVFAANRERVEASSDAPETTEALIRRACTIPNSTDENGKSIVLQAYSPGAWEQALHATDGRIRRAVKRNGSRNGNGHSTFSLQETAARFLIPPPQAPGKSRRGTSA